MAMVDQSNYFELTDSVNLRGMKEVYFEKSVKDGIP